jgi:hypothetical protein
MSPSDYLPDMYPVLNNLFELQTTDSVQRFEAAVRILKQIAQTPAGDTMAPPYSVDLRSVVRDKISDELWAVRDRKRNEMAIFSFLGL